MINWNTFKNFVSKLLSSTKTPQNHTEWSILDPTPIWLKIPIDHGSELTQNTPPPTTTRMGTSHGRTCVVDFLCGDYRCIPRGYRLVNLFSTRGDSEFNFILKWIRKHHTILWLNSTIGIVKRFVLLKIINATEDLFDKLSDVKESLTLSKANKVFAIWHLRTYLFVAEDDIWGY